MKKILVVIFTMLFVPCVYANSGQVLGPLAGLGMQDFDHDKNGGTAALSDYAWLQFDTTAASYDGDADNDSNDYDVECVEGYFIPIHFDVSSDKGKGMYSSANSAVLSGYDVIISYTENAAGICVADDLFIVAP